jgi:diaminohydroxyphosphoribosylaminopyrimidine deaminase/5-amino-6-(5-phosphoribosylamino)uracil reductase
MNGKNGFMWRCLELAGRGAGFVAPNPLVGAVVEKNGQIIGEGWHQRFGLPHAEVNAINNALQHISSLHDCTLFVNLEPCNHFGKTPPCTSLIIDQRIPRVMIGCQDPNPLVSGKGIERLRLAGVEVECDILKDECIHLNRRFICFQTLQRPYIILKWAQTANAKIAGQGPERVLISNEFSQRLVHRWRSEEAAILIGKNTAAFDNPKLDNRFWKGHAPIRMVIDRELELPASLNIFNEKRQTIVFNNHIHREEKNINYYQLAMDSSIVNQILAACMQLNIQSILVEGGSRLLQSFIDKNCWDEVRVITAKSKILNEGLDAPFLQKAVKTFEENVEGDRIEYYLNLLEKRELTTNSLLPAW